MVGVGSLGEWAPRDLAYNPDRTPVRGATDLLEQHRWSTPAGCPSMGCSRPAPLGWRCDPAPRKPCRNAKYDR